ncbi:winged helix DNA-binding domain-containing protein, partial [Candidatus Bathyarchaeota archaeon]|nr:winged helix DNA-binding domain-containing protein [Candidatus Bathyarchaeota archaeon]
KVEGDKNVHYCQDEDFERLEIIDDDFGFDDARLLIYFDNMMWNRERVQHLFGFESKLEIYLPKDQRVYGYYHLPILYGDQLVARIEPKMDRQKKKLIIRGYWTEQRFKETEEYREKRDRNLEDFAAFHGAEKIEWLG